MLRNSVSIFLFENGTKLKLPSVIKPPLTALLEIQTSRPTFSCPKDNVYLHSKVKLATLKKYL